MDENIFLPKLGIIQALLQTLNEIFQTTKTSTITYSNYRVLFFYHLYGLIVL